MVINLLINVITLLLGSIFSHFPSVTTLPPIFGYDIDTAMVSGMGGFNTFITTFWPVKYMFEGFLAILAYFGIKMVARLLLGHRAPGSH